MALILGLPALFGVVSFTTYMRNTYSTKQKNAISQLGRHEYQRPASIRHSIREGLRVETSSRNVMTMLQEKIQSAKLEEDKNKDDIDTQQTTEEEMIEADLYLRYIHNQT